MIKTDSDMLNSYLLEKGKYDSIISNLQKTLRDQYVFVLSAISINLAMFIIGASFDLMIFVFIGIVFLLFSGFSLIAFAEDYSKRNILLTKINCYKLLKCINPIIEPYVHELIKNVANFDCDSYGHYDYSIKQLDYSKALLMICDEKLIDDVAISLMVGEFTHL